MQEDTLIVLWERMSPGHTNPTELMTIMSISHPVLLADHVLVSHACSLISFFNMSYIFYPLSGQFRFQWIT